MIYNFLASNTYSFEDEYLKIKENLDTILNDSGIIASFIDEKLTINFKCKTWSDVKITKKLLKKGGIKDWCKI